LIKKKRRSVKFGGGKLGGFLKMEIAYQIAKG